MAMFALAAADRRGTEETRRASAALKAAAARARRRDQLCHMTEPYLVTFEHLMAHARARARVLLQARRRRRQRSRLCAPKSLGRCVVSHGPWLRFAVSVLDAASGKTGPAGKEVESPYAAEAESCIHSKETLHNCKKVFKL